MIFSSEIIDKRKLEKLLEINLRINSRYQDVHTLLEEILSSAMELTEGEAASLLVLNREMNRLYFEIALGPKGPEVKRFSLKPGEGIAGWVAKHNRSLIVNSVEDDPRHFPEIDRETGYRTRSILAVPMRVKEECVGVIEVLNKKGDKGFTQEDLEWLEVFANQAGIAFQNARYLQRVHNEIEHLQIQITTAQGFHPLIAESQLIKEKLQLVDKIAQTDSPVLIQGESGVGKELFAEQIHLRSKRKDGPFVRVNCAALPESLLESELFGHVRGAFTDAVQDRKGRFELAHGGTIFLDEIGELPLTLQAKFLRVLQYKTFERLGSSEPIQVDVRIIAATNRNLEKAVAEGSFRQDLYYRLNVIPLYIPSLRERVEDIPVLAEFFLKKYTREMNKPIKGFTPEAFEVLLGYTWPGNVRELENVVERAVVISQEEYITPEDLMISRPSEYSELYQQKGLKEAVTIFKRNFIQNALRMNRGNQTLTAKKLGIQRTYLAKLIKEYDIKI
ncbi:sigma 54-interacting transcriptional regulator [Spirochaeta thermophila]|uniref:Transcriptional regulator, NifA subfamily, Fis Family n=2 Tax=Winmispira thermophila TaxID=154 RepID=G0GE43_WINT7|nr:sigma 54-interacting transcriptional regulator [Spirochaeta thermophila]ADN02041.1 transcriptional regulatory protein [Spirochaeta thermophila DSM 6192]AEJ61396.1 transcriptional regulator, NifA subfamily, Fis Family [Spirochaeta thermophila DSM 6578]